MKILKMLPLAMFMFLMFSCKSSVQSDAEKVAALQCKAKKMMEKVLSGNLDVKAESEELQKEAMDLAAEMQRKYTSKEDLEAFQKAYQSASSKCE